MIKFLKIFLCNFLLLLLIILFMEFSFYKIKPKNANNFLPTNFKSFLHSYNHGFFLHCSDIRKNIYGNSNKNPIMLLGCSYTYGEGLQDNETFGYFLNKNTNRTIYNYGIAGGGPRETLYLLRYYKNLPQNIDIENIQKPEYIIYTYIESHKVRINYWGWSDWSAIYPFFKKKNNKLIYKENYSFIHFSKILVVIKHYIANKIQKTKKTNELLNLYFCECKKETDKLFPGSKFVILVYEQDGTEKFEALKDKGFIIITLKDLSNINFDVPEYQISTFDRHPNAKAWQIIVPSLVKRLNI